MNSSKIVKAGIWNIIGTFLLKGITFLSVPIFTRLLSQTDYGYVSTYTTYISFVGIIIGLGMNTAIYNARIDYLNRFNEFNSSIIKAAGLVFIFETTVANIFADCIASLLGLTRLYLNLIFIISFSEYVINSYFKINTIDFKFKTNVLLSLLNSVSNLAFSILFIIIFENDVLAKLIGQSVFLVILACILFVAIAFKRGNSLELDDIKYSLNVGIPNIFHQFSQLIMAQSDRVMILHYINAASTAMYSVVYTYALVMQMLWNAINEVWVPWLYRKLKSEDVYVVLKYSKYYIGVFSVICSMCMLIMPDFMFLLAPDSYNSSKTLISVVILATYFVFLYSFFVNLELYYKKNRYLALATFVSGIFNIIGNAIFIPRFGYGAAAYTTLASYTLLMIIHYFVTEIILRINIYRISFFLPFIIMTTAVAFFTSLCINTPVYRWMLFIALMVAIIIYLIKNKFKILSIIKEIRGARKND